MLVATPFRLETDGLLAVLGTARIAPRVVLSAHCHLRTRLTQSPQQRVCSR
jgi:hypothetical protein